MSESRSISTHGVTASLTTTFYDIMLPFRGDWGFKIGHRPSGNGIFFNGYAPLKNNDKGPAELGKLFRHRGDIFGSVDGISLRDKTLEQAQQIFSSRIAPDQERGYAQLQMLSHGLPPTTTASTTATASSPEQVFAQKEQQFQAQRKRVQEKKEHAHQACQECQLEISKLQKSLQRAQILLPKYQQVLAKIQTEQQTLETQWQEMRQVELQRRQEKVAELMTVDLTTTKETSPPPRTLPRVRRRGSSSRGASVKVEPPTAVPFLLAPQPEQQATAAATVPPSSVAASPQNSVRRPSRWVATTRRVSTSSVVPSPHTNTYTRIPQESSAVSIRRVTEDTSSTLSSRSGLISNVVEDNVVHRRRRQSRRILRAAEDRRSAVAATPNKRKAPPSTSDGGPQPKRGSAP
mmetsp:Transcript_11889/g.24430  ORF Transcript_11889/g.24430 Transcript_11889/m.24430 type:complete len:405 (-) Transcript_11889:975-2189(-)